MPRKVTIFFPDGTTEYWFTASVLEVGDKLDRGGLSWIVTSIARPDGSDDGDGKHTTITVRQSDAAPVSRS